MVYSKETNFVDGQVLLFNKPYGITSFQVVNNIRWHICRAQNIKKLKVGHAGTLDPLASGLLILCTGKATKQMDQFLNLDKEYIAELKLGAITSSYDLETEPTDEKEYEHITREKLDIALEKFTGEIDQVPPIFSAVKQNGNKAYEMAREGKEVVLNAKKIKINELEVLKFELPFVKLRVFCSKGTYIRSLAHDIGQELGCGAHLVALERTKIGDFKIEDAMEIEAFERKFKLEIKLNKQTHE